MKIDKNTPINRHGTNQMLRAGAKAAGYAFGGKPGAKIAENIADNPNVQQAANAALGGNSPVKQGGDIGQKKVQNSLANRARNLLKQRNNNKKQKKKKEFGSSSSDNQQSAPQSASDMVDESIDNLKARIKRRLIIKALILILPIFGLLVIIAVIYAAIASYLPFLVPSSMDSGRSGIDDSPLEITQEERTYYDKLNELEKKYLNDCNQPMKKNLLHASLLYLYYQEGYNKIDYSSMTNMASTVYNLFPESCGMDYNVGGTFYNNLKNSTEFNNYYSIILQKKSMDAILEEIFDLGERLVIDETPNDNFIPEDTTVNIDSGTGTVIDSPRNSGTGDSSTDNNIVKVSFKDYLLGVVYANVSESDYANSEKIKAYVIVYTSNALAKGSLSVDTQMVGINDPEQEISYCNVDKGCSYVVKDNKLYLQVGGGPSGNGNSSFYNGKYYFKKEMDSETKENLQKIVDEVYGIVLLNSEGKYEYINPSKISSVNITDYSATLTKVYSNLTIKNLRENNYVEGIDFYNQRVMIPTIAYDQSDYRNVRFCGRSGALSTNNIESSGCGVTAIAIVISSYKKSNEYDPPYMSEQARIGHFCGNGIYGTLPGIFWNQAESFGYKVLNVGKYSSTDLNLVLSHLSSGHFVITNVGPGTFTRGGHYIVLSGVDPVRQKVYVTDPYNRGNKNSARKSGSGWYDFNLITKEAYTFYIIY